MLRHPPIHPYALTILPQGLADPPHNPYTKVYLASPLLTSVRCSYSISTAVILVNRFARDRLISLRMIDVVANPTQPTADPQ